MESGAADRRWRRTFWINFADLSLFWGGDAFASLSTVLPLFVSRLSDSSILVGLVPTLYWIGFVSPQMLVASYVRRWPRKKPFAMAAFGIQRLSMFALAAVTFALGDSHHFYLLLAFLLLYTFGCLGIGAGIPPYQDMIAKVVPVEKRGRLRGWGVFAASALGVVAGFVARQVIEAQPFPHGFAICFAIAGLLGSISLLFASANREPSSRVPVETPVIREYLARLPAILSADSNFRSFTWSRIAFSLALMAGPFLPIYALGRFALPDQEVGTLTAALMAGQMISVLTMGFAADRYGHRVILQVGALALACAFGLAMVAQSPLVMLLAFGLVGCSNAAQQVSVTYIVMEMAPETDRPAYIAMSSTLVAPAVVLGPLLGGWIVGQASYGVLFGLAVVLGALALLVLTFAVREPRWPTPVSASRGRP
jgi:MFS family permease